MALLTEGETLSSLATINRALLAEGEKSKLPSPCGTHASEKL